MITEDDWKCGCRGCGVAREQGAKQALAPVLAQISDWTDMFGDEPETTVRMSYVLNQLKYAIGGER